MADNYTTNILEAADDEPEYLNLKVDIEGRTINVRIDGWDEPHQALLALYHLGKPERIQNMVRGISEAAEGSGL